MSIFTGILFIVCVLYGSCRFFTKIKSHIEKNTSKTTHIIVKDNSIDMRFHSVPNFDFPNVQSESDLRITNTGPDLNTELSEIEVKQYCKY